MIRSNFSKSTNSTISKLPHSFLQFPRRHENPINTVPWSETVLPKQERKKKKKKKHQPNNPINVTRTSTPILFYHPSPIPKVLFSKLVSFPTANVRVDWTRASLFSIVVWSQPKRRRRVLVPLTKENTRRKLEIPVGQSDDAWPLTDSGSARRVNI